MTRIVRWGNTRYEVVREGCASGMRECPNAPHSITVHQLKPNGERKHGPGMTQCLDSTKVTEDE